MQTLTRVEKTVAEAVVHARGANVSSEDWVTIYRFPHMVSIRTFTRFKVYQVYTTACIAVATTVAHMMGYAGSMELTYITGASLFAMLSLYVVGNILRRVIGFVYVSHDGKHVKLSHLDFWGRRVDLSVPVTALVPLRDSPNATPFARQLFLTHPGFTEKYLILPMIGRFEQPDTFADVFGIDASLLQRSEEARGESKER